MQFNLKYIILSLIDYISVV